MKTTMMNQRKNYILETLKDTLVDSFEEPKSEDERELLQKYFNRYAFTMINTLQAIPNIESIKVFSFHVLCLEILHQYIPFLVRKFVLPNLVSNTYDEIDYRGCRKQLVVAQASIIQLSDELHITELIPFNDEEFGKQLVEKKNRKTNHHYYLGYVYIRKDMSTFKIIDSKELSAQGIEPLD